MRSRSGRRFDADPGDAGAFTRKLDRAYSRLAGPYDLAVRHLPVWKTWLGLTLPRIGGPRALHVAEKV